MKHLKKEEISQEVFDLYDEYAHDRITRREFIDRLSLYAVGGITLATLMSAIMPDYNRIQVQSGDDRVVSEYITYPSPKGGGEIKGLLSKPKKQQTGLGGIVVVHENRGLNPHIEDVCRRAALAGFIALAPDALSPLGGYPGNDEDGKALQRQRDRNEMLEDFKAAFSFLKEHPDGNAKVGVVGFCFGGWISNRMAVELPELSAAVPFYGRQPTNESVESIQAPIQLHYASLDKRVNEGWPAYEKALKKHSKWYEAYFYENTNHGFHNDTTPRFDEEAAKLAWTRTVDFFDKHVK